MKRTIITSALPYINGVKHLGNLIGSLLPADIYARFLRQRGEDVIFICGTDEHGAPAEIAAELEGKQVQQYCESMFYTQKSIYERFDLSFDHFGRSSCTENHVLTKEFFTQLYNNGHIVENEITQLYDVEGGRFLPDRFVIGTCPFCGFQGARGDQCENCTKLLDAIDLLDPRSAVTGSRKLEHRQSKHLFLRLSDFEARLTAWVKSKENYWPNTSVAIAKKWLREGLKDRCITRDLKWGITVPLKGFEDKVFYVWFDAPNAYIAITQEWARLRGSPDLWRAYWMGEDTRLVQFMAKDNVPFHTVIWPAMIMGIDDTFILADLVKGFEYLKYYGGKFSTSSQRGIFTDAAIAELPSDYWRFYLTTIAPERSDSDFTWPGLQQAVANLADNLGNFVNRTLTFLNRYFEGKIPPTPVERSTDVQLWNRMSELVRTCDANLYACNFNGWIRELREVWTTANRYFDTQAPWVTRKTSPKEAAATMYHCVALCKSIAILSSPLVPALAGRIFEQLNLREKPELLCWKEASSPGKFPADHVIAREIQPLCKKIEDARVVELEEKYKGTQVSA